LVLSESKPQAKDEVSTTTSGVERERVFVDTSILRCVPKL
jgi:hypothetical protein